jgi:hypothetical protein
MGLEKVSSYKNVMFVFKINLFISQNKKALEYIKKGYKLSEAAKLADFHKKPMTKIKKNGFCFKK